MPKSNVSVTAALGLMMLALPVAGQTPLQPPADKRVRITVAAVVEWAGVVRLEGETTTGDVVASDVETVTLRGVGLEPITLPRPRRKVVGVVATTAENAVYVRRADGSIVVVPRPAIAKVERANGRRSRIRAAGLGFLIGAGGGAGVGYLIGATCHPTGFLGCFLEPWGSTFAGIVVGGGAGALVGALTPPQDRWVAVSADWLEGPVGPEAATAPKGPLPRTEN
jgi:hypothetical protein